MTSSSVVDADGIEIAYRLWPATAPIRSTVVIAHGASEHSGRYGRFAGVLASAGYAVYAPDHRGHGLTSATHGRGVIGPRGMAGIVDGLDAVVRIAAADTRPVVLFGHSMGSVIALRYAQTHPESIDALVLSGAIGVQPGVEDAIAALQTAVDGGLAEVPMDALGAFNDDFEPARTPFDWLSRDDAEVDAYLADELCGSNLPLTYGYIHQVMTGIKDGAEQLDRLRAGLPVLIMSGERDPVSNFTAQVRDLSVALRAVGCDVTESYYADARHELLNETNRDEVQADILQWLTRATS